MGSDTDKTHRHKARSDLTQQDIAVLASLQSDSPDEDVAARLDGLDDRASVTFAPALGTATWCDRLLDKRDDGLLSHACRAYAALAMRVVRHPTDIVFLTHIITYTCISLPSAVLLFRNFTYTHALLHALWTAYCAGPFTLLMHNHIHQSGLLKPSWKWLDSGFPYLLCPLMGHTWNSYYYHHCKMHHVESNGPDDISSTLRYQRDSFPHFAHYLSRFLFTLWIELPRYFLQTKRYTYAVKSFTTEIFSYAAIFALLSRQETRAPAVVVFLIPLALLRAAMALGNWGQHAFVDEVDPTSDFRSSITVIDVASNRYCFNDGYHTSHHLHPRRHWRAHPASVIRRKQDYASQHALFFYDIDFFGISLALFCKKYDMLARKLVPVGAQRELDMQGRMEMLTRKVGRFSEEDIRKHWKV